MTMDNGYDEYDRQIDDLLAQQAAAKARREAEVDGVAKEQAALDTAAEILQRRREDPQYRETADELRLADVMSRFYRPPVLPEEQEQIRDIDDAFSKFKTVDEMRNWLHSRNVW